MKQLDISVGEKYGLLCVVSILPSDAKGNRIVRCMCDCGNSKDVRVSCLKRGNVKSCGCLTKEQNEIAGQRFGELTVLERIPHSIAPKSQYKCMCSCGNFCSVAKSDLLRENRKSCGCLPPANKRHGLWNTPEYKIWGGMLSRCQNVNNSAYKNYGSRGIQVAQQWSDFAVFIADVGMRKNSKDTLERIYNEGNYEPGNVRWASRAEQALNKRTNNLIQYQGKTQTLKEWMIELSLNRNTVTKRLRLGWTVEEAFETQVDTRFRSVQG